MQLKLMSGLTNHGQPPHPYLAHIHAGNEQYQSCVLCPSYVRRVVI